MVGLAKFAAQLFEQMKKWECSRHINGMRF